MSDKALWERIEAAEQRKTEAGSVLKAVKKKNKTDFPSFFHDMLFGLGLRNIFYGIHDVVAITGFAAAVLLLLLAQGGNALISLDGSAYACALALSPAIYIGFFALTFIKEKSEGSYEVKMTCRYTALHLCAFRMFICGGACFLINTAAAAIVSSNAELDFLKLLAVSFFSLFMFALITIISLLRNGIRGFYIPVALLFTVIVLCAVEPVRAAIQCVPALAYAFAGAAALLIFQRILNKTNRRLCNVIR